MVLTLSYRQTFSTLPNIAAVILFMKDLSQVGCALTFASEAKFEIEAKILFRFEAKKKPDFT
jgi:hypothetical protein